MAKQVDDQTWLAARLELLEQEKAFSRARDELTRARMNMPGREITSAYAFSDLAGNTLSLADLFDGCSQLIVQHYMFAPDWDTGCKSCAQMADTWNGVWRHLKARDVTMVAASAAPPAKLDAFRARMGWNFPWVSHGDSGFGRDFGVSFDSEKMENGGTYNYREQPKIGMPELPGISVFRLGEDGRIWHTYSTYARGLESFMGAYTLLDIVPKGRNEDDLPWSQAWFRLQDEY